MRKLLICTSIAAALGLAGCGGGDTIEDIQADTAPVFPSSRVVFDPGAGILSAPNDLLVLPGDDGFFDYTLNIPVDDPTNFGDPTNALNVLDGWSTSTPFVLDFATPANTSLDPNSLAGGILIYEATLGLDIRDPDCAQVSTPSAGCKVGDALVFGQDYVLSLLDDDSVSVVPLRPLKPAQGYMLVVTTDLRDSNGNGVRGSTTWESVKQDINEFPLSSESQLSLQALVNSYINPLLGVGHTREEISYVSAFTTQSTATVLETVKQLHVAEFAARFAGGDPRAGESLPLIVATNAPGPQNAMETLGLVSADTVAGAVQLGISTLPPEAAALVPLIEATDFSAFQTCDGLLGTVTGALAPVFGPVNDFAVGVATGILTQAGPFCAAERYQATVSLPYFLPIPRPENPLAPVNEFWNAACDSGIVLAGAPAEVLGAATPGPNAALCQQVGLADLRVNDAPLDFKRNVTRFSPVPQPKGGNQGNETLDVQITVPNAQVSAALGFPISKPDTGWPVAILMHGITRQKEDMLALTGALSLAGFATVAIDHPLHGSRGFDLNGDGIDDLNATTVSATHYMNLASLPTARDNLRQSVSDMLGLRLGLHALIDATPTQSIDIDENNVSMMGVSLGAITGGNFAAVANTPFEGDLAPLSPLFAVNSAALESPGGGIANFLLESNSFGPLIQGLLLSQSSEDFQNLLVATFGTTDVTEAQLVGAVGSFLGALTPEQLAGVNAVFSQFVFAAQSVLDAGDPINYGATLGANTPVLMQTVVGDGGEVNLPDQVIPVSTALPLSGQLPYASVAGLENINSTAASDEGVRALVTFNAGAHGSSLSPTASPAVTAEMQRQIASFLASQGNAVQITDTDVIAN